MAVYSLNHNAMFLLATQPQLGFRVQGSFLAMDSLCAFPSTNIFVLTACGPRGWSHPPLLPRSLSIIGLNRYQRQKGDSGEIADGSVALRRRLCGGGKRDDGSLLLLRQPHLILGTRPTCRLLRFFRIHFFELYRVCNGP